MFQVEVDEVLSFLKSDTVISNSDYHSRLVGNKYSDRVSDM